MRDAVRRFHLLIWNCLHFFKTFADIDGYQPTDSAGLAVELPIDAYMLHELESLRATIDTAMEGFYFSGAYAAIEKFVNVLSTWYIRLNKNRMWREGLDDDKRTCYQVLWTSLRGLALVGAPFLPFLAESMWRVLGEEGSVHLQDWPAADRPALRPELAEEMDALQVLVTAARNVRDRNNSSLKVPLREMRVAGVSPAIVAQNLPLLLEELNVKSVVVTDDVSQWVQERIVVNLPELASTRPQIVKEVQAAAACGRIQVNADGTATATGFTLGAHEFHSAMVPRPDVKSVAISGKRVVWLDLAVDEALLLEADAREINRRLQGLRKEASLSYTQRIRVFVAPNERTGMIVRRHGDYLKEQLLATELTLAPPPAHAPSIVIELRGGSVEAGLEVAG